VRWLLAHGPEREARPRRPATMSAQHAPASRPAGRCGDPQALARVHRLSAGPVASHCERVAGLRWAPVGLAALLLAFMLWAAHVRTAERPGRGPTRERGRAPTADPEPASRDR
jgi:hypothetical protein